MSTIIFQRTNCGAGNFDHHHYGETDYYVVKKTPKDPKFKVIFNSLHGVIEAIENQYLKELHLIFAEGNNHRILEKYKYKFFYNKEGLEENETRQMKKQILVTVTKHLTDINELKLNPKLAKDSKCYIFLTYYDNAPKNYEPFFFEDGSDLSHLINEPLDKRMRITFEKVSTGFHSVVCSGRIQEIFIRDGIDENENEVIIEETEIIGKKRKSYRTKCLQPSQDTENQTKNGIDEVTNPLGETTISIPSNGGIDESWDLTICNDNNGFNCICGINETINDIDTVICSLCNCAFHYLCISVFMNDKLPPKFVCWDCAENIPGVDPTNMSLASLEKEQRETIVTRFLILYCILDKKSYPEEIINKLSEYRRKKVLYFLQDSRFIRVDRNKKILLDFGAIENYINVNNNIEENDSSRLPETQDIAPKKRRKKM